MHLGEGSTDQAAIGSILTDYLTNQNVPLTIVGSETSTDIAPLKTALEQVTLATSMQGIQANLVTHITADINADSISAVGAITIYNPLDTPFSIASVKASTNYSIVCSTSNNVGTTVSVGVIDYTLPEPATIQPKETQTFNGWPITGIDLFAALPIAEDPYAIISLTQTVVTLVDNIYNTGEIAYTESGVPLTLTVLGSPLIDFSDNPVYWDYDCQCAAFGAVSPDQFANQTTCLDGTPVVYRNATTVTHPDTLNATLASNTTTTTLNATTTLAPTSTASTVSVTTTDSVTTTLLTTTEAPTATSTTTDDSDTATTTDSSSDPTTTENPEATPETQTASAGTSAPTESS
jgi:hypothetical protein